MSSNEVTVSDFTSSANGPALQMTFSPVFDRCKSLITITLYSVLGLMRPDEKVVYEPHSLISNGKNCCYQVDASPQTNFSDLMEQLKPILTALLPPLIVFTIVMGELIAFTTIILQISNIYRHNIIIEDLGI